MSTLVELVSDFISIPSVAGDEEACKEALAYILDIGRDLGFRCYKRSRGMTGVIEMGEGNETVGILTHVDVAHPGNLRSWSIPPFAPEVVDEILYGRGAIDNKGPAVAALAAMQGIRRISEQHMLRIGKKIRMIISTSQETGGDDIKEYILTDGSPDYSIALDGVFPVGNSCKGTIQVMFSFPLEGKRTIITDIIAGNNPMTVPESCRITLNDGRTFGARGTARHISNVKPEENAILVMANALEQLKGRDRRLMRGDAVFRILEKLKEGFVDPTGVHAQIPQGQKMYHNELTGIHSFTPTAAFVSGGRLYVTISGTHATDVSPERILSALELYFDPEPIRLERIESLPARFIDHDKPYVRSLRESYRQITGKEPRQVVCPYDSMLQLVPSAVSFGPLMPEGEDTRHCADERIPVRTLTELTRHYERALGSIVFSEKSYR